MAKSVARFVWYELMTTDVEAARAFYADVVGWGRRDAAVPGLVYSQFTVADAPVAGLMPLSEEAKRAGAPPQWIGYVGVDDVDAAVERIKRLGGAVHVPPTDPSALGRFSLVADPQMATLALVRGLELGQARSRQPGTPGHVGWHELLAADWVTAMPFYTDLFGWRKTDSHVGLMGTYQQFSAGPETIGGMFTKSPTLPVPFWLYYFNTGDIEAAATRAEAAGGEVVYGPTEVPGGAVIVQCIDPQGAIFALMNRHRKAVGYFVASGDRADTPGRRWPR